MWGAEASEGYSPQKKAPPSHVHRETWGRWFPHTVQRAELGPQIHVWPLAGWGGELCPFLPTPLVCHASGTAQLCDSLQTEHGDAQGNCA